MDTSDLIAIIISAAAFLTSIAGPFLTAFIQCNHEAKMYANRFITEHKHAVIENYLKTAGKCSFSLALEDINEFGECVAEIFMYAPKELWDDIRDLNNLITDISQNKQWEYTHSKQVAIQSRYLSLCEKFSDFRRFSK